MAAVIGNRSKEIAMMGKKLVKSRVSGKTEIGNTSPISATLSRGIHSSMYDKNPEGYIQPTLVPDEVANSNQTGKYWVPHPETGVFVPLIENSLQSTTRVVNNEGRNTVMEQEAWFRPNSLEDLEKPNC